MAFSFAIIRFFAVIRQTMKAPLASCPQEWMKPKISRKTGLREEDAVLFVPEHGNQVPARVWHFRLEAESGLLCRPFNRSSRTKERTFEALSAVMN
jgi:hypothetical protein